MRVAESAAERLIAHRGESYEAPENTLASVRLAWERGIRSVEVDARLTADRKVVLIHDADTSRIGGPDRPVSTQIAADLTRLDAGAWKGSDWRGECIPALGDILATIPPGGMIFLELKGGLEWSRPWPSELDQCAGQPVTFISFNLPLVAAVKNRFPANKALWIVKRGRHPPFRRVRPTLENLIARANASGVDGVDLGGELHELNASAISQMHEAGLLVCVWTINEPAEARRLLRAGVDGLATDRAAWMRDQLNQ